MCVVPRVRHVCKCIVPEVPATSSLSNIDHLSGQQVGRKPPTYICLMLAFLRSIFLNLVTIDADMGRISGNYALELAK